MNDRPLALAPLLLAVALSAAAYLVIGWGAAYWEQLGVVFVLAWAGERWLAPLTVSERAAPMVSLGPPAQGLKLTAAVVAIGTLLGLAACAAFVCWVRLSGRDASVLDGLPQNVHELESLPAWLLRGVVFAPVFEELIWRGLVQRNLERGVRTRTAIFLSGLLFWAMHWLPIGAAPTPINQLIGGWVIAWAYARTGGGLLAPILLHAAGNLAIGLSEGLVLLRPEWLRALLG